MPINPVNNSMPSRLSMTPTTDRKTQGLNFGEKVASGLQSGVGALSQGASLLGGALGGNFAGVVSAAASGIGGMAKPGGSGGAVSSSYAAGVSQLNFGSGASSGASAGGSTGGVSLTGGSSTGNVASNNSSISEGASQMQQMIDVQVQMQRENQMFTSISNVLKTRHETAKNSISNVR
jgi:hypothetical protein